VSLEERLAELVRDAVRPMLNDLEQRLAERLAPPKPEPRPELLTASEVARLLRVDRRTVRRMAVAGEIPAPVAVSAKRSRWRRTDIDAWLAEGGAS